MKRKLVVEVECGEKTCDGCHGAHVCSAPWDDSGAERSQACLAAEQAAKGTASEEEVERVARIVHDADAKWTYEVQLGAPPDPYDSLNGPLKDRRRFIARAILASQPQGNEYRNAIEDAVREVERLATEENNYQGVVGCYAPTVRTVSALRHLLDGKEEGPDV